MYSILPRFQSAAVLLLLAAAVSCGGGSSDMEPNGAGANPDEAAIPRYLREYVYVGSRDEAPLVAPFLFRSVVSGDSILRTARAGLAFGATWDPYLEETWSTSAESGVWRVLPRGDLRLAVGGSTEIDALWYQRGERNLRVNLNRPLTTWNQGSSTRFRLVSASLVLGSEATPGVLLETLQVRRPGEVNDSDHLFLVAGDSLRLVLSETLSRGTESGRGFAWLFTPQGERSYEQAEVRWLEMRSFEDARRDIPLHWSFRVPSAGIEGEITALGMDPRAGPERPGRRAVEIRYTVEGWIQIGEQRSRVIGVVRHIQE